jgi:hypothetical protein
VVPVAAVIGIAGWFWFRRSRETAELGHPAWLLISWAVATFMIFVTYVFGAFEIHWWLATSVVRTTIFSQFLLVADIAIWALVASGEITSERSSSAVAAVRTEADDLQPVASLL